MKTINFLSALAIMAIPALLAAPLPALAADAAPTGAGIISLAPLLLIVVIFYFLLIRPQQKRLKEHRSLIGELKKGDKIITAGGLYGTVQDVSEKTLKVDIANGVRVRVKRDTITGLAE